MFEEWDEAQLFSAGAFRSPSLNVSRIPITFTIEMTHFNLNRSTQNFTLNPIFEAKMRHLF